MSIITEYLSEVKKLIDDTPLKLSTKIYEENRGEVALYLKGEIVFPDLSELHFKEYFIAVPFLNKLAYSYHYHNRNKELIFRFDNAEHHQEIKTCPYHKHIKGIVLPAEETSLKEVLTEILNILPKS